jgi:hypothetical protein
MNAPTQELIMQVERHLQAEWQKLIDLLNDQHQCDLNGIFDNNQDELVELLETGSVTLRIHDPETRQLRTFELALHVKEVTNG